MQTGCDKFPYFDWLMLANPKRQRGISQRVNKGPARDGFRQFPAQRMKTFPR
jgi:hypothetical protein